MLPYSGFGDGRFNLNLVAQEHAGGGVLDNADAVFGNKVWSLVAERPLGSQTKRELELLILGAAIDSGLLEPRADLLAEALNISMTRAHTYLTDVALRKPALSDSEGVTSLLAVLKTSEIVRDQQYFSIPMYDAALRIWIERKIARLQLNVGDSLRRDHLKLSIVGLLNMLEASHGLVQPFAALQRLPPELREMTWAKEAQQSWKNGMGWKEALGLLKSSVEIVDALYELFAQAA